MSTWPESNPTPRYPLQTEMEYETLISNFDGGTEQRRQKLLYPRYNTTIKYPAISKTEAQTLWNFYVARKGSYESFYIFDLALLCQHSFAHTDQYCGTGDSSTTIFDIPGRSTSSRTTYLDNIEQTSGITYLTGGGASAADRIQFSTAPTSGEIITVDFTGYLRMKVRFAEDKLTRENFVYKLYSFGIKLKGLSI